jgi:predicted TIM-barrel fold metal-dependent hydrolase
MFTTLDQPGMHHLSSFLTHGVFEKFPTLKVLFKEHGFTWVPWLIWNLDAQYPLLRRENPLVKRPPSEYFREHVFCGAQPFPDPPEKGQLIELLDAFGGMEDVLVYSSDYAHWDGEDLQRVAQKLPANWHRKFFHDNAARFYGDRLRR